MKKNKVKKAKKEKKNTKKSIFHCTWGFRLFTFYRRKNFRVGSKLAREKNLYVKKAFELRGHVKKWLWKSKPRDAILSFFFSSKYTLILVGEEIRRDVNPRRQFFHSIRCNLSGAQSFIRVFKNFGAIVRAVYFSQNRTFRVNVYHFFD